MCRGYEKYHFQCGHMHSFFITIQCESARRAGRDCTRDHCFCIARNTVSPPLCVNCYKLEEEKICDYADEEHSEISQGREDARRALEDPHLTSWGRRRLDNQIEKATDKLNENREERALTLKAFRDSQGVWGDG